MRMRLNQACPLVHSCTRYVYLSVCLLGLTTPVSSLVNFLNGKCMDKHLCSAYAAYDHVAGANNNNIFTECMNEQYPPAYVAYGHATGVHYDHDLD